MTTLTLRDLGFIAAGQAAGGDPFFSNVVLLLGGDATPLVDESSSPKTLTTTGTAGYSTAQKQFGNGSIFVNGTGSIVQITSNAALTLSGDFTIEFWLRSPSQSANYPSVIASAATTWSSTSGAVQIGARHAGIAPSGAILLMANGNESAIVQSTTNPNTSTWNFWAISRSGSTTRLFCNGVQESINTTRTDILNLASNSTRLGMDQWNGTNGGLANAYIDELRITTAARYTGTTCPVPTDRFPRF